MITNCFISLFGSYSGNSFPPRIYWAYVCILIRKWGNDKLLANAYIHVFRNKKLVICSLLYYTNPIDLAFGRKLKKLRELSIYLQNLATRNSKVKDSVQLSRIKITPTFTSKTACVGIDSNDAEKHQFDKKRSYCSLERSKSIITGCGVSLAFLCSLSVYHFLTQWLQLLNV